MEIRSYKDSDYESVIELYKNSELYGGQFDEDRDSRERLEKTQDKILVCEDEGKIVGTVSLIEDERTAWLFRFASMNDEATKLLFEKASEILKSRGHKQVLVYSPTGNNDLNSRYQNLLGFEKGEDYTCFWKRV